jgi:hypothetical protein
VGTALKEAQGTLARADFDPHRFNPFQIDYSGREGYSLLTLQIAIWALQWSRLDEPFSVPHGFPSEVFERRGSWTLGWVAMIGHDSDTYGATAGPLLAILHGDLPPSLRESLRITD